ncbi:MAG: hypothetical protein V3W41_02330 [Planctomycetota bacterium]
MMNRRKSFRTFGAKLGVVVLAACVLASCGDDDESSSDTETTTDKINSDDAEKRKEGVKEAGDKYK